MTNGSKFQQFRLFDPALGVLFDKMPRPLIAKVKAYWLRFRSVLTRLYKYGEDQLEYFVETMDKVKIRRSDLERVTTCEEVNPEDGAAAAAPPKKQQLLAVPDGPDGKVLKMDSLEESKAELAKFIEIHGTGIHTYVGNTFRESTCQLPSPYQ